MKYYLGTFKNLKKYEERGLIPISISSSNPDWFMGFTELIFAPPFELEEKFKNKLISDEEYKKEYLEQLDKDHVSFLIKGYPKMFKGQNIIFISNSESSEYSHRNILANYFDEVLDIELDELLI
jgi:uncharacterized protein YeaO (DUF488 family)